MASISYRERQSECKFGGAILGEFVVKNEWASEGTEVNQSGSCCRLGS